MLEHSLQTASDLMRYPHARASKNSTSRLYPHNLEEADNIELVSAASCARSYCAGSGAE